MYLKKKICIVQSETKITKEKECSGCKGYITRGIFERITTIYDTARRQYESRHYIKGSKLEYC